MLWNWDTAPDWSPTVIAQSVKNRESYCGVAEEAEYDHGESGGEDGAEHDAGQRGVDQSYDHILCSDQHRARPAVQRAPQLQGGVRNTPLPAPP